MKELIDKYIRNRLRIEGIIIHADISEVHDIEEAVREIFCDTGFSIFVWISHNIGEKYCISSPSPRDFQCWYKNGMVHRDGDLPAKIWVDGCKEWYKDGKSHRDGDKPAVINNNGRYLIWYKNGEQYKVQIC